MDEPNDAPPPPRQLRARTDDTQPGDGQEPRNWKGAAIAVGLAMGAAAIAGLVLTGMQSKAIYSKPVDELLGQKAKFMGRPFSVINGPHPSVMDPWARRSASERCLPDLVMS